MTPDDGQRGARVLDSETEHTIKNHLAVIAGFCELLLAEMAPGDPHRTDLEEIGRSAGALIAIFRRES